MMQTISEVKSPQTVDLNNIKHERIATQCICCGSQNLLSNAAVLMPFIADRVFNWKPIEIDDSWGLKSIKNGHAYSICNSLFCRGCGLLFLDIRFSDIELCNLYQGYRGLEYTALREFYEPGYAQRNNYLESLIDYIADVESFIEPYITTPISVLDWGGDTGKNTPFKNRSNIFDIYDLSGKEVVDGAVAVTREQAFSKKYDLVVCSNVLEHVSFPFQLLHEMKNVMGENSILYIEVPFEDVMKNHPDDCFAMKRHWHEHINFYSKQSLRCLIENSGFTLIEMKELTITTPLNFENKSIQSTLLQVICKLN